MRCVTCGEPNPSALDPCPSCGAGVAPAGPRSAAELEAAFAADPDDPPTAAAGPLRIGQDFGTRYLILKLLGMGGMGVVYQALDRDLNVQVALKVLRPAGSNPRAIAELHRRFKTELILARRVTHKHVIRIHDIGEIDGIKFITMPYVKGQDLATILKKGSLPVVRALRFARQIAAGLVAAHAAGVIHRDLKPANIMIDEDDNAVLMDFGIARSSAPVGPQRTIAGAVVGTAAYMAPEQARGELVDHRADIYAFGLILYEMLCGPRFMPKGAVADLFARLTAPPAPARAANHDVPEALDAIVTCCVQPSPADRYQTAVELATALAGLSRRGRGPVPGAPPPARDWPLKLAVAAAILLVAALAYWFGARSSVAALASAVPPATVDAVSDAEPGREAAAPVGTAAPAGLAPAPDPEPVVMPPSAPASLLPPAARSEFARAEAAGAMAPERARPSYDRMSTMGPRAASVAAAGLADLELYRGHYAAAAEMLQRAIEMDTRARNMAAVASNYLALAEARAAQGRPAEAVTAVEHALGASRDENVLLPAARMYISLDRPAEADALARELAANTDGYARAYAGVVDAELAMDRGDAARAIATLESLLRTTDLWLARFVLGHAYLQSQRYADASGAFETCQLRRAEATSLFAGDVPTLRYFAELDRARARVAALLNR
jgi:hypothetical protein